MGLLKSCWDVLLQLAALTPFNPYENGFNQQPILSYLEGDNPQAPILSSPGNTLIHPETASPGFQCVYPKRWKSCNTPTSRDCWLQDTETADAFEAYSQIDINTDCKKTAGPRTCWG